jgi:CRISPR-associated endonuclease/helicase Cas3
MPAPRNKSGGRDTNLPMPRYYWAKTTKDDRPGISVRDHCLNVGCVAEALLNLLPHQLRDLLPVGAATLAALHDIGKVSPGFQQKCQAWIKSNMSWFEKSFGYEARHQRVSQIFLDSVANGRLRHWAEALGAHHGRIQGDDPPGAMGGKAWEQARQELFTSLITDFNPLPNEDARNEATQWLLSGLIVLSDWLGSDENNFSPENCGTLDKAKQRAKADTVVQRLELAGATPVADKSFEDVFMEPLKGSPPRPLQRTIITAQKPVPGVYVIEDVMGSGKTEAALWLAYRLMVTDQARGLYFGLPTRVTSDRIHRRVRGFLAQVYPNGGEPPLVHGQAWLKELPKVRPACNDHRDLSGDESAHQQAEAVRKWFASARRGLLAPFAVGTVDQALLGVVAAKWFFLRQFALAGKVVVLDEVHSYDLYTGTLIQHLVKRLRELSATPVILSATLTAKQRASLVGEEAVFAETDVPYPAITVKTSESAPAKLLPVESHTGTKSVQIVPLPVPDFDGVSAVVAIAAKLAAEGRNVVWIRNTVRHAQEAYRLLNSERQEDAFEIGLLHSRFPAFQRASYPKSSLEELKKHHLHEERWLWMLGKPEPSRAEARPKGSVLVATQVVEQSVDIDADVLITDIAPTDMLLQRLGRLHRHDRGDRGQPTVYLVVPQLIAENSRVLSAKEIKKSLGSVGRVYSPYVLVRTWELWRQPYVALRGQVIRQLLEDTYSERNDDPADWRDLYDELETERKRLQALALSATNVRRQPLRPDEEGLGTRFTTQRQLSLLLVRWVSDKVDKGRNPAELHLLNGKKLMEEHIRNFNIYGARQLHLNVATIPAWWAPKSLRRGLPPMLAQYFVEDIAMAVYLGPQSNQLVLNTVDHRRAPVICYHPLEGLWLDKPPDKGVVQEEYDGENEDGMF